MFIRAYLRASTQEQDAARAQDELRGFAQERGWRIAATYMENVSGATLQRPELFRLLSDSHPGDVLLIEQIDRLTRLGATDWDRLKSEFKTRRVRIVAMDLPTTWMMAVAAPDEVMQRIFDALNDMIIDMIAALARKDYDTRRHRQAQGISSAKARGAYRGRPENLDRNTAIIKMLRSGQTWDSIKKATGCSASTLSRLKKRLVAEGKAKTTGPEV